MMQRILSVITLCILSVVGNTAVRAAPADSRDLDQVMGMLAMRQHGRVEFIEQQFLAVLSHPVESSGELRYDAPDRLQKRTLQPHAQTLVLAGGILTVERGHSRHLLGFCGHP